MVWKPTEVWFGSVSKYRCLVLLKAEVQKQFKNCSNFSISDFVFVLYLFKYKIQMICIFVVWILFTNFIRYHFFESSDKTEQWFSFSKNFGSFHIILQLTWQWSSHLSPLQPGAQVQWPSSGLHAPPFPQMHAEPHPKPQVPLGQLMEQSNPCHPD